MKTHLNQSILTVLAFVSGICLLAGCTKKHDVLPVTTVSNNAIVSTFAGSSTAGWADGLGQAAEFLSPWGIAIDPSSGNTYVTEPEFNEIRKITPEGMTSLFAGAVVKDGFFYAGNPGVSIDGTGTSAFFSYPKQITVDGSGMIYVFDTGDAELRKITPGGVVTTVNVKDVNTNTPLDPFSWEIVNITAGLNGNLYACVLADSDVMLYKITPDGLATFIAGGKYGFKNGNAATASFYGMAGMVADASGNLYVTDYGNHQIRKINPNGDVSTVAGNVNEGYYDGTGTAAYFNKLGAITIDKAGNLYVIDGNRIRKITAAGVVTTVAGTGSDGIANPSFSPDAGNVINGPGSEATFNSPMGIAADANGSLYIADYNNDQIRKITFK